MITVCFVTPSVRAGLRQLLIIVLAICTPNAMRAQEKVRVREVAPPDAVSRDHFGLILGIRELSGGKVLVNDGKSRQLVMLDRKLENRSVVIDSMADGGQSYGATATPIIPYLNDSTFFVDGATSTLLLLGPAGSLARVVALPKVADIMQIASSPSAIDSKGNLLYAIAPKTRNVKGPSGFPGDILTYPSDSSAIVRGDFDRRTVETVTQLYTPAGVRGHIETTSTGRIHKMTLTYNPLTTRDEWAVYSDGSIGVVREHDYHVDVVRPDGTKLSGPKLPFDFKRVTEDEKRALIDSSRASHTKEDSIAATIVPGRDSVTTRRVPGTSVFRPRIATLKAAKVELVEEYVSLDSMPDYWPPIRIGAVQADLDAHLWILPTTSAQSLQGELVYDVVNTLGDLVYRVRAPLGRLIVGFGANGTIYFATKSANGWSLERASLAK